MEIGKVIWSVFAFLGMAIVAVLLYDLLFAYDYTASSSAQGDGNDHMGAHTIEEINGVRKGALWVAADAIQSGASLYYYNYCYLPVIHETDVLDQRFGLNSAYYKVDWDGNLVVNDNNTPTNLNYAEITEVGGNQNIYTTGWR